MTHQYDFYDSAVVNDLVRLTWRQFLRRFPTRWARSTKYEQGTYTEESLPSLIGFCAKHEPRPATLARILSKETVYGTLQRAAPQSFFLVELVRHARPGKKAYWWAGDIRDMTPIIGAATVAFLDDRVSESVFAAVMKLHRCDPRDWLRLSRAQQHVVGGTIKIKFQTPVFSWQRRNPFGDEEWTDGLGVAEMREFLQFIESAWLSRVT